jgi:hypothetical protein
LAINKLNNFIIAFYNRKIKIKNTSILQTGVYRLKQLIRPKSLNKTILFLQQYGVSTFSFYWNLSNIEALKDQSIIYKNEQNKSSQSGC